ncbi:SUMF1/EgtB/PvdO family nonheme iron enzyme [Streptomyces sp. NPDC048680]|uniref:formylglycine-generating enzyme family protein n=1 Tax=Streptomyces sp. NPDC048680 TaxID=3155492 RepID=UPI0034134D7B
MTPFAGHVAAEPGRHFDAPVLTKVKAYAPNGFGLYDASGNVWERCADRFSADWHRADRPETRTGPAGPPHGENRVLRGGSYLFHRSYWNRYRIAARTSNTPDSTTGHGGFRCALQGTSPALTPASRRDPHTQLS